MSSNYNNNRRGGGGGYNSNRGGSSGGGGYNTRRRNNNFNNNKNRINNGTSSSSNTEDNNSNQSLSAAVNLVGIEGDGVVVINKVDETATTTTTTTTNNNGKLNESTQSSLSSSSSSSSSGGSSGTGVFNTADEGEGGESVKQQRGDDDDDDDGSGEEEKTVQEISDVEEDEEAGMSVVNASLIVNLSKMDESRVVEEISGGGGGDGDGLMKVPEIILVEASPVKREEEEVGVVEQEDEEEEVIISVVEQEEEDEDDGLLDSEDSEVEKLTSSVSSSSLLLRNNNGQGIAAAGGGGGNNRVDVSQLPGTVTVLEAGNGVVVYLVGTAHFSHQSQVDVANTIQLTQPTIVLLELCSSRKNILELDEETVLKEVSEMNFQKIRLALSNSGTVQGTLHLLLLSMSAQLTKKLGMAPGGEFRVAAREARKIPGNVVLLGDRPFNITIARALSSLSLFQKVKLAWQFLTCNEDITREEIEKCKEKDLLERMLTEMTGEFPSITEVFVNERDKYLAHSLWLSATSDAHRSNGGPVVGVVGMGHVAGIVRNWGSTTEGMINEIIKIPETPLSTIIIRKSVKILFYSVLGYSIYKLSKRVGLVNTVVSKNPLNGKIVRDGVRVVVDGVRNLYL